MRNLNLPSWTPAAVAALGACAVMTLGGMAVADAVIHPEPASSGRVIEVRYQLVRAAAYAPPPPTEEARLDVRPSGPVAPDASLIPATWTVEYSQSAVPMEDVALQRTLASIRAEDAKLDRELKADLARMRAEPQDTRDASNSAAPASAPLPSSEPASEG